MPTETNLTQNQQEKKSCAENLAFLETKLINALLTDRNGARVCSVREVGRQDVLDAIFEATEKNEVPIYYLEDKKIKWNYQPCYEDVTELCHRLTESRRAHSLEKVIRNVHITPSNVSDAIVELQNAILRFHQEPNDDGQLKTHIENYEILASKRREKKLIGFTTGYLELDKITEGIQKGHLWAIGGYTSVGKTFFLLNLLINSIKRRVIFFSLEMSGAQIIERMLQVYTNQMKEELLDDTEKNRLAKKEVFSAPWKIYTKVRGIEKITAIIESEHIKNPIDIIAIDYFGLIEGSQRSDYENYKYNAFALQSIAQRNGIPVIVLSQINNEHAKRKGETIGLKGGGDLPAATDITIELENIDDAEARELAYKGGMPYQVLCSVKKNRHNYSGRVGFNFYPWRGTYETTRQP